ncbi:MAG: hypothetical protein JXR83_22085 [Deltaproteobacteria bacterium]|nr:hypothetical protein [Deltaproteobacteria bacterium]
MRSLPSCKASLAILCLLPLVHCTCEFGTPDAGKSDGGGGTDVATAPDTSGHDTTGHDTTGHDTYVPPTDAGPGRDNYTPPRDAARPDTWHPPYDANFSPDVIGIDTNGMAGLGESCSQAWCVPGTTCLGTNPNYYCRKNCTLEGTDCNMEYEHCTPWQRDDAGVYISPGGCIPANRPGEECDPENCADLYLCVAPSGTQDFLCRYTCTPGASEDGGNGCPPDSPQCLPVTNMDAGACMPGN